MKKYIQILMIVALLFTYSCNYLDIVPDETATEEDAFADRYAAERYLYSCYAFIPQEANVFYMLGSTGDWATLMEVASMQGNYSPSNLSYYTFWSSFYGGIKRCYILLDNIDGVPRMDEETKELYKAEARFLLAYFHFFLLKAYGPIPIIEKNFAMDTPNSDYPGRRIFDECVKWISDMYDMAYMDLPERQATTYYGRATRATAKAMKAKLWLYTASPLFNGNGEFYADELKDPETGTPLMPLQYDQSKWEKAYTYALEAVNEAHSAGISLYMGNPDPGSGNYPYPSDVNQWRARMNFVDRANTNELIFADTRNDGFYGYQNNAAPREASGGNAWQNVAPTLEAVKRFYTERGLPIDEDPAYFSEGDYFQLGQYEGQTTCNLHLHREPRFYAWISFHNGWYELMRGNDKRIRTLFRKNDVHGKQSYGRNYSMTGYLAKKGVHPGYNANGSIINYPFPIMRLAELYLIVAEAAVETNNLSVAIEYLDKVRVRSGVPKVETAWEGVATLNQVKLRQIVHQERGIELFMEGHSLWDHKRWKTAHLYVGSNPKGLNVDGVTDAEFFREAEVLVGWKFASPKNYLLPIPQKDVDVNAKLSQNPGY
ncbi:MAG: RagB/SusD family nutrient uptake outer membrane protein [Proteiniphilum sp.]